MNDEKEEKKLAHEKAVEIVHFHIGDCACEQERACRSCSMISDIFKALLSHGKSCYERGVAQVPKNTMEYAKLAEANMACKDEEINRLKESINNYPNECHCEPISKTDGVYICQKCEIERLKERVAELERRLK